MEEQKMKASAQKGNKRNIRNRRNKSNNPAGTDAMNYIEETLKFVESKEMQEHLLKWMKTGDCYHGNTCADIIINAPVPLEHKIPLLELIPQPVGNNHLYHSDEYAWEIEDALNERYNHMGVSENPADTVYKLLMFDQPHEEKPKIFKSFDEAVDHINQTRNQDGDAAPDNDIPRIHEYGRADIIEKWVPDTNAQLKLYVYWYLNDVGKILYYEYSDDPSHRIPTATPGRLKFSVPFKPGDIVATDCAPFAGEKKVLILENNDYLDSVDCSGVTCLFLNDNNNLDIGYLKLNEFLQFPKLTYVSVLYRVRLHDGELTGSDARLGIIGAAIKKNPKLGREIFKYLDRFKLSVVGHTGNSPVDSDNNYFGVGWKFLKEIFGFNDPA